MRQIAQNQATPSCFWGASPQASAFDLWPHDGSRVGKSVAGVTVSGRFGNIFGAVVQTGSVRKLVDADPDVAIAKTFEGLSVGEQVDCGVGDGAVPFEDVDSAPFANAVVLKFDKERAEKSRDVSLALSGYGVVLIAVGASMLLLGLIVRFLIPDLWKTSMCWHAFCMKITGAHDRRMKAIGQPAQKAQSGSVVNDSAFDKNGVLKEYTCKYGVGAWCGLFCFQLKGGELQDDDEKNDEQQLGQQTSADNDGDALSSHGEHRRGKQKQSDKGDTKRSKKGKQRDSDRKHRHRRDRKSKDKEEESESKDKEKEKEGDNVDQEDDSSKDETETTSE